MKYNVNMGELSLARSRGGSISFRPHGKTTSWARACDHGAREEEDVEKLHSSGLSARVLVGLNVGDKPKWTVDDVVERIVRVRRSQGVSPSASIISQRGIYEDRARNIVDESSVQIVILDLEGSDQRAFTTEMLKLAETLRGELEQESVILEIQKKGIQEEVYLVT